MKNEKLFNPTKCLKNQIWENKNSLTLDAWLLSQKWENEISLTLDSWEAKNWVCWNFISMKMRRNGDGEL
jgi:hypothetical protein